MTPPPAPQTPTIDEVHANLQNISTVTGKAEQFIGPANSGPPSIANNPEYAGLDMQDKSVQCTIFESFDHSALVANVDPIQSESVDAYRQEWATASNTVTDTFETFSSKIGRAISDKWTGPAGESASAAILGYANDSYGMATASNLVARQVGLLTDSLSNTKTNLPKEPAETAPGKVMSFFGRESWDDERREEAKRQAVELLNNVYYGSGISPTASAMPKFPEVHPPGADSPVGPGGPTGTLSTGSPSSGDGGGAPGNGGGTPGSPTADQVGPAEQPGSPTGDRTSETPTGPSSSPESLGSDGTPGGGSVGSPTNPSAAGTSAAGMPGMGAGGGLGSGGGAGGLGSGGLGAGGGAAGAGPGTLGAPNPGGGAAAGAAPAAAGGVAGRAGMPGMGMGAMGGARGAGQGGDKDEEHKTPDYLRNDELSQWVDAQGDRAYAPVIGAQRPRPASDNESK
ncbi:hypothetical protein [Rhodococcus sp. NPDC058521]|uniref:hypothetical protein n=1 Tax=Rhodococcus sp. NPDC058521 TaxID=3346536 RepID=UPI0036575C5D